MGCNLSQLPIIPQPITETRFGVAKVSVLQVKRDNLERGKTFQSYLTLTITNQSHTTKEFSEQGVQDRRDVFTFIVNSRYQINGRALVVELWDKGVLSDKSVGMGMIDLNKIAQGGVEQQVKVYLNDTIEPIGWVQLQCSFQEMPTDIITLMFDSAMIRRKTSRKMKCKIRVSIGEQILTTKTVEDLEDSMPSWREDILTFYVIRNVTKEGKVVLLDETVQVGTLSLNLDEIVDSKEQQIQIREHFYYLDNVVAGTVRLFINKGDNRVFHVDAVAKSVYVGTKGRSTLPPLDQNKVSNSVVSEVGYNHLGSQKSKLSNVQSKIVDPEVLEKQKQAEIDIIRQEYEQKSKINEEQKAKLLMLEKEKAESLESENRKLISQYEQKIKKMKEDLAAQQASHVELRTKRQEELALKIKHLEDQNQKLKKTETNLNQQIVELKTEKDQPHRTEKDQSHRKEIELPHQEIHHSEALPEVLPQEQVHI